MLKDKSKQKNGTIKELNARCDMFKSEIKSLQERLDQALKENELMEAESMRNQMRYAKTTRDLDTVAEGFDRTKALLDKVIIFFLFKIQLNLVSLL